MTPDVLGAAGDYSIPLAAFIVSAAGLAYGIFGAGRWNRMSSLEQAMNNRIEDLIRQLDDARGQLHDCASRCAKLEKENWKLARRISGLESGDG